MGHSVHLLYLSRLPSYLRVAQFRQGCGVSNGSNMMLFRSLLANDSAFISKQRYHLLERLRQHHAFCGIKVGGFWIMKPSSLLTYCPLRGGVCVCRGMWGVDYKCVIFKRILMINFMSVQLLLEEWKMPDIVQTSFFKYIFPHCADVIFQIHFPNSDHIDCNADIFFCQKCRKCWFSFSHSFSSFSNSPSFLVTFFS